MTYEPENRDYDHSGRVEHARIALRLKLRRVEHVKLLNLCHVRIDSEHVSPLAAAVAGFRGNGRY